MKSAVPHSGYPSREEAIRIFEEKITGNPGNWVDHSRYAAFAAEQIAAAAGDMDPEKAYVLGLLHDIGRHVGIVRGRHQIEGYRFCMENGWTDCARICLTHTHLLKPVNPKSAMWDISAEEVQFIADFIDQTEYDDYDLLIQLCDSLARSIGLCVIEIRMVDVGRRYGVGPTTLKRWNRTFELKSYFDKKCGSNIYFHLLGIGESSLLP